MPRQRKSKIVSVERINQLLDFEVETGIFRRKVFIPHSTIKVGDIAGCVDGCGYIKITIDCIAYPAHYLAWAITHGSYPTRTITQINGNRQDCRPSNLQMNTDYRDGLEIDNLRELLDYNPETGIFTWKVKRSRTAKRGDIAGDLDESDGYIKIGVNGTVYKGHRLVWFYVHGEWPEHEIDHINGIRDDNRLSNLREATDIVTAQNRGIGKNNLTGRVGVASSPNGKKYVAFIRANGVQHFLGTFDSFEKACEVRRQKEIELYGEYARDHGEPGKR